MGVGWLSGQQGWASMAREESTKTDVNVGKSLSGGEGSSLLC